VDDEEVAMCSGEDCDLEDDPGLDGFDGSDGSDGSDSIAGSDGSDGSNIGDDSDAGISGDPSQGAGSRIGFLAWLRNNPFWLFLNLASLIALAAWLSWWFIALWRRRKKKEEEDAVIPVGT